MNPYQLIRPLLFLLDAERAHHGAVRATALLEALLHTGGLNPAPPSPPELRQSLCGLAFPNPVGLAAGFDKDARAPHVWPWLGFGFAELGTLTRHAQPGNPTPRMFRLAEDRALINRLGFNNGGADAAAERLAASLAHGRPPIPLGLNLGKSKVTPLEEADEDYLYSLRALFPFADYLAVNVSSPNTPGLRDLQGEVELAHLVRRLSDENRRLAERAGHAPRPMFVKLAPDLADEALEKLVGVVLDAGADGLIATNTTITRPTLHTPIDETGGLSGAPLRRRANDVMRILRATAGPEVPLIGVGGIGDVDAAWERLQAGANLVQVYSAMVFEGPFLARRLVEGLANRVRQSDTRRLPVVTTRP